jgi:hypothetical protein
VDIYTGEFSCVEEYNLGTSYSQFTESKTGGYGSVEETRKANRYYKHSILM